jgi:NAD(P)-dependent dehydrogenase (short-subunit alcohol dehydrogenase family)
VLPLDLSQVSSLAAKGEEALSLFGRVDVLVNNGGVSQRSSVLDTDIDTHRRILDVNYTGAVALTKSEGKIFRNVCCSILHIRRYSDYANVALILRFILNNSTLHKLLEIQP